jgi:antitoxin (DNA-binding transcriptional repressor) of toxin-antitoxin stability system
MARIDTNGLISVTDANNLGVSRLVRDAEHGQERVLLRNNKPVAAVVSMKRLEEWEELESDLTDIALTTARMMTTGRRRHSLDDVLERFGYSRERLRQLDE